MKVYEYISEWPENTIEAGININIWNRTAYTDDNFASKITEIKLYLLILYIFGVNLILVADLRLSLFSYLRLVLVSDLRLIKRVTHDSYAAFFDFILTF